MINSENFCNVNNKQYSVFLVNRFDVCCNVNKNYECNYDHINDQNIDSYNNANTYDYHSMLALDIRSFQDCDEYFHNPFCFSENLKIFQNNDLDVEQDVLELLEI